MKSTEMNNTFLLNELLWIINTINKNKLITLEEISDLWKKEIGNGLELTRLTFSRRKARIKEMFDIHIGCVKKNKNYYYYLENEKEKNESVQKWMLTTYSINDALSNSTSVYDRIILERVNVNNSVLAKCISAMRDGVCIDICYHKYSFAESRMFRLEPYCLKLFHQRWYLLAHFTHKDSLAIFALDRIKEINFTDQKFEVSPEFNPSEYFENCYGIVKSDLPAEHIVIRAFGTQQYYLRDLPLHPSQVIVNEGDGFTDFEYLMYPTGDLKGKIISLANTIQVMSPEWFAKDIKKTLLNTVSLYHEIHLSIEEEQHRNPSLPS